MNPIFSHSMDVRWREMDALGHVNNAQFLSYVEETRVQWFNNRQSGWQEGDCAPIVAAIHVDFRKPIVWPERIQVALFAVKRGSKSVTIGHRIGSAEAESAPAAAPAASRPSAGERTAQTTGPTLAEVRRILNEHLQSIIGPAMFAAQPAPANMR